ncbi:uncharacterized protein LOC106180614 [Lingula anatina]|uniref:Uncharacterized protein LOC106180614 n=1 Tax=Lingula anatina TaxID=7574 RepID=A0A2R2MPU9_LINAN|nr:uncharacterized protein LOC106180614 [Lingula anatina]|eukprot:XP_023932042.1 uncharacterized protein LOC106180614 [Lingula anatina]
MAASRTRKLFCVFLHFTLLSFSFVTCSTIEEMNSVELKSAMQKHLRMVVYFYTDDCTECERQLSELEKIATALDDSVLEGMPVVKVKSVQTAAKYGVSKFPSLVYFRSSYPMLYGGDAVMAEDVFPWLERNVEVVTRELTDEDFEHLTQAATGATTGDWFVSL